MLDLVRLSDGLAAWMDAIGLDRAAGCQVVIDFAARRPERVIRGVIQGPKTNPAERTWLRQIVRWRQNGNCRSRERSLPLQARHRVLRTFRHALRRIAAEMLVVRGECDSICPEDWAGGSPG